MSFFALLFRKELGARLFSRRFLAGAARAGVLTGEERRVGQGAGSRGWPCR